MLDSAVVFDLPTSFYLQDHDEEPKNVLLIMWWCIALITSRGNSLLYGENLTVDVIMPQLKQKQSRYGRRGADARVLLEALSDEAGMLDSVNCFD